MSALGYHERVAARLAPAWYAAAYAEPADPADVELWVTHVAETRRTLRAAALEGTAAPAELTTLLAITGISEGQLLIALAEHHDRPDVAELLEGYLAELHAIGPDGRPLLEDPTAAHAVVVRLADRTTRRTS